MDRIQIFLCVCLVITTVKHVQSCEEDIYRRLDQLEKKVESLTNELLGLKLAEEEACKPCSIISFNSKEEDYNSSSPTSFNAKEEDYNSSSSTSFNAKERDYRLSSSTSSSSIEESPIDVPTGTTFKVLDARREKVPDGIMFTVRYWTDGQHPVYTYWTQYELPLDDLEKNQLHKTGSGIRKTRVFSNGLIYYSPILVFSLYSSMVKLSFNRGDTDQEMSEIHLPVLKMTPPGDIVYQPGQDVSVALMEEDHDFPRMSVIVLDPKGTNSVLDTGFSYDKELFQDFVSYNTVELSNSSVEIVTFKTSKYPTRGLVIMTTYQSPHTSLLYEISRDDFLSLRSSNEMGPFPPGRLTTYAKAGRSDHYKDGTYVARCSIEDRCFIQCSGIGMGVTNITMSRHNPDGTKDIIKSNSRVMYNSYAIEHVYRQVNETGNVTYSCQVFANDGRSSQETFEMQFMIPTRILNKSHAVWVNDTTVELKCVFRSMVQPQSIQWSTTFLDHEYKFDVEDIEPIGEHMFSSTTYMNVDERASQFYCAAECFVHDMITNYNFSSSNLFLP